MGGQNAALASMSRCSKSYPLPEMDGRVARKHRTWVGACSMTSALRVVGGWGVGGNVTKVRGIKEPGHLMEVICTCFPLPHETGRRDQIQQPPLFLESNVNERPRSVLPLLQLFPLCHYGLLRNIPSSMVQRAVLQGGAAEV